MSTTISDTGPEPISLIAISAPVPPPATVKKSPVINEDEKTVDWKTDLNNDIFIFYTIKNIKKDEEMLTYYDYWYKIKGMYIYTYRR